MTCMNVLIDSFQNNLTPRRAIARFVQIATPVESPDPRTLVKIPQRQILLDAPLAISSSQNSQRSGHPKQKLGNQEQAGANASEMSMAEDSQSLDSILDDSELPSEIGSPTIVNPRHRQNERRMSTSHLRIAEIAFLQAIQNQESLPPTAANSSYDDSLPELLSPILVNPRLRPNKKRLSKSIFKKAYESLNRESSDAEESDEELPAQIPSPEIARPASRTRLRNYSGSQYLEVLNQLGKKPSPVPEDILIKDNGSEDTMYLSGLGIDETVARPQTSASRVKKKASTGASTAVLNQQPQVAGPSDSDSLGSSFEDLEDELTFQRPVVRPRKRASSTLYKEVLSRNVNYKLVPSDVELRPVVSPHSSLIGSVDDGQEHSSIPISSSSVTASVGSRKTKSPGSDDSSSFSVQQPELGESKKASSSQQRSEEKTNEQTSDEEEDEELHKRSAADKQRRSESFDRRTPSSNQSQTESHGSLSGPSTLETSEFVKQRKTKSKPKVSSTPFDQVLEGKASASDEDLPLQKEKFAANQRQRGSSGRKTPSSNQSLHEFDSPLSGRSTLETSKQVKQRKTKNKPKVSSTQFDQVLEEIGDEELPPQKEKFTANQHRSGSSDCKTTSSNMTLPESDCSLSGPSTLEAKKAPQSGSSSLKTPPSNKSHESGISLPFSPDQEEQPKGDISSKRTPAKSTTTNEPSGRKSVPQTADPSNTTTPLEASGIWESQQQEKSRAKAPQSGSSSPKAPPSIKSHEYGSSLSSSPEEIMQPKGVVSSPRTPAKSPATNGASGRESVPQTSGPSNTTAPLEASRIQKSQQQRERTLQEENRAKARQSEFSGRKMLSSSKSNESESPLPASPEQEKQPEAKNTKLRVSTSQIQKVSEENVFYSDDELSSFKKGKSVANNHRSGSTNNRKTLLSNKSSSLVDSPDRAEQPKTKKSTRLPSARKIEKENEVVEEGAIPQEVSAAPKRKIGSTGRRMPLSNITNKSQYDSEGSISGHSSLFTPELVEQSKAKETQRVSSPKFHQALEEEAQEPEIARDSNAIKSDMSFHGWTPLDPLVVQETLLTESSTSFVQPKASSTSSREPASSSKTVSTVRSVYKRVYGTALNLKDRIDSHSVTNKSTTWFVPWASSTHMPKTALEEDFEEEEEDSVTQTIDFSLKSPPVEEASDAVSLPSSSLQVELDSPKLAFIPRRYEKYSANKGQSMKEYLAAWRLRNTSPEAETPADGVLAETTPTKSPATNEASGRTSLPQISGPINTTGPPLEASGKRESLSVSNRTRRSLEFNINSPEVQDTTSKIQFLENDPYDGDAGPPSVDDFDENGEEALSSGEEDSVKEEEEEVEVLFVGQSPATNAEEFRFGPTYTCRRNFRRRARLIYILPDF